MEACVAQDSGPSAGGFPRWSTGGAPGREESEADRLDRNFGDLLQELRVAQAGVQILFAFLLTLPFAARFAAVDTFDKIVYIGALVTAALATASIVAPVAYHRILFRRGRKLELVQAAHRMASLGLAFLFVSMMGAILLATDVVLGLGWAVVVTSFAAIYFALLWWVLPWRHRGPEPGGFGATP
jgi:Family of unknown function (DUF6328)